ncbi:MAG: hypothetical protein ABI608_07540 [Rhizomicrobium sp.]
MADDPVSAEVRDFLVRCIDSVAQLEALLLLRGPPPLAWNVPAVARRLYVEEGEAAKLLSSLVSCELAVTNGSDFHYDPRDSDLVNLVNQLAETYARSLVPVTQLIHERDIAIRNFADAFKIRKDK